MLHYACVGGSPEIIKECINLGGKLNEGIFALDPALYTTAFYGHTEAVKLLVASGCKVGNNNILLFFSFLLLFILFFLLLLFVVFYIPLFLFPY